MPKIRDALAQKKSNLSKPVKEVREHPAEISHYQDGSFIKIDIQDIQPDPNQPRKHFDQEGLAELAESIKQRGVIQPVIVRFDAGNNVLLIAGERRYRAAKMAGLSSLPAIVKNDDKPNEIALIENIQREDLKPMEEAEALAQLMAEYEYTQEQLAKVVGKSRTRVTQLLSLNRLPEEIKAECRETNTFSRRLLVEVAGQKSPEEMRDLFKQVKKNNLSSEQIRSLKKRPPQIRRRKASIFLEKVQYFSHSISKFDLDSLEDAEKVEIIKELEKTKELIDSKLN